ncbi:unnamed protein product [Urochloa humidicola]
MATSDLWAGLGSALAFLLALFTMAMNQRKIKLWINRITPYFNPYIHISIPEYSAESFKRSDIFVAIEAYLSDYCARSARSLKAELGSDSKKPQLFIDDGEEITDKPQVFNDDGQEITDTPFYRSMFWWHAYTERPKSSVISFSPGDEERRFYRVVFHRKSRDGILKYLEHVLETGRKCTANNRQRRLFTNNPSSRWSHGVKPFWSHVAFQHPATFDKLAMDSTKKKNIVNDLEAFRNGKQFYDNVGKAWKRGYLLFGPPGTGKSTMIAAMANYLDYDIYDLELTAVKNNNELRKLFIETTGKSIIVIEDIDRSIDFIGKCRDKEAQKKSGCQSDTMTLLPIDAEKDDDSTKLTLSGMLNFIDGLWSACGGERIIVFTTNNKDKLDPALIRQGRMDMHIEMSYCCYEAFKDLASNYLHINEHQFFELFGKIQRLLEVVDMTPAEVAEKLMSTVNRDADACLKGLVVALEEKAKANEEEVERSMEEETIE